MKHIACYIFPLILSTSFHVNAQEHLVPPNGENGVAGPYNHSFEITWASVQGAAAYEFVVSDNPLCFAGCPGDTRQAIVADTTTFLFNLQENRWYYWITRIIYTNKDTTNWSNITSFLAVTPGGEGNLAEIHPNPAVNGKIGVHVDWAINPRAEQMEINLHNSSGVKIAQQILIKNRSFRYQDFEIDVHDQPSGLMLCIIQVDDNPNNPNNRIINRIIINQ